MTYLRLACTMLLALLLSACKVSVVVPLGGTVSTESGSLRCNARETCTIDVSDVDFDETFIASPAAGFEFKGWRRGDGYFCGGNMSACRLATSGFVGNDNLMAVLNSNRVFYLEPVFESTSRYRISGTISALNTASVDSDLNDVSSINRSNNTTAIAQIVSNPTTLGGHANVAQAGNEGQTYTSGDDEDFFAVDLARGQKLSLVVGNPEEGDLDLYLYNASSQIVDYSVETGQLETLTVPATGRYYVNVYAYSGASNYTLMIGQAVSPTGQRQGMNASAEFEPGFAMVKHIAGKNSKVPPASIASSAARAKSILPQRQALGSTAVQNKATISASAGRSVRKSKQSSNFASDALRQKWQTLTDIKALSSRADVAYAVPNFKRRANAVTPNDEYYSYQWHYPLLNLPAAWEITTGSADVVVAVLDTGVLLNHPDLQGQLVPGYDFIADTETSVDGDGRDDNPDDPGDAEGGQPSSYHGTHVAGTIAASSNNQRGVAGVAWGARVMPIRVLGKGGGYDSDIAEGIKYAAGLPNVSGQLPARKAAVINMSLGGTGYSSAMQDIINRARQAGVVIVAAAGNESTSTPSYPASYDGVISVSAVGPDGTLAPYSNYGGNIDVAAPGGDLSVDRNGDGRPDGVLSPAAKDEDNGRRFSYVFYEGTSMAAPHVAGVIALMKSVSPNLSPSDIDSLLRSGAMTVDSGAPGRDDRYGYGLVDAFKSISAVRDGVGNITLPPQLSVSPRELGLTAGQQVLTLGNSGNGSLRVNGLSARHTWLRISALETDGNGLGRYGVALADNLAPGVYQSFIDVSSSAGNQTIPVIASIGNTDIAPSVGLLYLLIYDRQDRYVTQLAVSPDANGRYHYTIDDLLAGDYYAHAGTDMNNDNFICDSGEACGSYLTTREPLLIEVDRNRAGVNFGVSYETGISAQATANTTRKRLEETGQKSRRAD